MAKTYKKLRLRILEKYDSQKDFAKAIGLSEQSVGAKLGGRSDFSQSDILAWSNALDIGANDVGAYFFEEKLSKR